MESDRNWNQSLTPVVIGGVFSALGIWGAYWLSLNPLFPLNSRGLTLVGIGSLQALVQLIFFFHLGKDEKPYWNGVLFVCFLALILVVVWGTLWILSHLDANLMPWMEGLMDDKGL